MISDETFGIWGTATRTWILTLVLDTVQVQRAIIVRCTFGTATGIGVSIVFGQTLTRSNSIIFKAIRIRTTWIGYTGSQNFNGIVG